MKAIHTNLTTSGNSVAIRLPKALLEVSGLSGPVTLEASENTITIRRAHDPREGWDEKIAALTREFGDPSEDFKDFTTLLPADDLAMEWSGITYEEWCAGYEK